MRFGTSLVGVALGLMVSLGMVGCDEPQAGGADASDASAGGQQVEAPVGKLRHVVHFKFNDDASDEQIAEVERAFAALPDEIDAIIGFEYGYTDISVEDLHDDFTHCFILTFEDVAGLEEYIPHPAHEEFVDMIGPLLEDVFVVDYYVRESADQ